MNTKYTFGYFYPTSPNSEHFKMPKGGYHVSKFNSDCSLTPLFAFKNETQAILKCNRLINYEENTSSFYNSDGEPFYKEGSIL